VKRDLLTLAGGFAVPSAVAELVGATNLGTAFAFGQMGFAGTLVWLLVRRK
jgi:hypothetical protein